MGFTEGITPELLPLTPVSDPIVDAMAWAGVLLSLIVLPSVVRLWRLFVKSLTKRSSNQLPAAERTIGERLSLIAAILLFCLMWGMLLYCAAFRLRGGDMALTPGSGVAVTAAAALLAVGIQVAGYLITGYAFASPADTTSWVRALSACDAMMAYWIMLPALGSLLFPSAALWLLGASALIFLATHILLWVKTFHIFYTAPFSIFYFFLYLCTLEIVPLLIPVGVALFLC